LGWAVPYSPRFDPTYKELKLLFYIPGFIFFARFDPTYKELKLNYGEEFRQSEVSFDPTYKELKPTCKNDKMIGTGVLILPIRN